MVLCYLTGAIIIALLAVFINFFARLDCDFTTYLYGRYGKDKKTFKGKVVWITGASVGIGAALALELASAGAKLIISATREAKLEEVKKKCLKINNQLTDKDILVLPMDVTAHDTFQSKFDKVIEHFGKLDVMLNNAGAMPVEKFEDTEFSIDKKNFDLNVFGPVLLSRIATRHWLKNKQSGHLVVNSSTAALLSAP